MRTVNEQLHQQKKIELMEKCFDCYAKYGFNEIGVKTIAKACGVSKGYLYTYFDNLDDLIIQSTDYCMSKVEEEFMEKAPKDVNDIERFIDEIPYWTAKTHGKKYRLMYQIYTNPMYYEFGKKFFSGVNQRYANYAKILEPKIGISHNIILGIIFIFVRTCVHFALFEDEFYLNSQLNVIKLTLNKYLNR